MRALGLIGVPTSAGAFAPGQEQAPAALRAAGLLGELERGGWELRDHGDRAVWRWRPDRASTRAQNLGQVVEIVQDTARRVSESVAVGETTLVLGGDCTIGIGAIAGHVQTGERIGVVYFDSHADLNVPNSVTEGALDWMGMAHMLAVEGAAPELAAAGGHEPLLTPEQVTVFGWGPQQATGFEREQIASLRVSVVEVQTVAADPEGAALRARTGIESRCDRLVVHFDVDVIDFTDVPLSENWGRNEGVSYEAAIRALRVLLESPKLSGLTVTELNPDHVEEGAGTIERFSCDLAASLSVRERKGDDG